MYHNVQYLHFVPPPLPLFAVPSVCSVVLLQCLILVDGLYCQDVCEKEMESLSVPLFPFCPCGLPKFACVCVCTMCHACSVCVLTNVYVRV